jgi:hypothetical protein
MEGMKTQIITNKTPVMMKGSYEVGGLKKKGYCMSEMIRTKSKLKKIYFRLK